VNFKIKTNKDTRSAKCTASLRFKVIIHTFKFGVNTVVGEFYVYANCEAFNYIYKCVYGNACRIFKLSTLTKFNLAYVFITVERN